MLLPGYQESNIGKHALHTNYKLNWISLALDIAHRFAVRKESCELITSQQQSFRCKFAGNDPLLQLLMKKQQNMKNLMVLLLLCLTAFSQNCPLGGSSSTADLLQSGNSLIYNSYINTPAKRQHSFTFTVNFNVVSGLKVAASASSLQVSTANGVDFAIWGGQGPALASGLIVLLIDEDNSWSSIRVHYLASARSDFFLGSFSAGIYFRQKQAQTNTINWNQALPSWTASQKNYNIILQLAGVQVSSTSFAVSLTGVSFNALTGTISTTISLSSTPFVESIVITYIIFEKLSPISFSPFNVNSGSTAAYQFIGIDQILSGTTTLAGYGFSSGVSQSGVSCIGGGCPAACITIQACQSYSGTFNGTTCLICGSGQVAFNGQCITPNNCGPNQYYNGSSCVCFTNYVMVNNACYVSCGVNAFVNNSQCSCIPGYTYSPSANQCMVQSTIVCGANFVAINNKCVCPSGLGILNNQCVQCPLNSYVDQYGNCSCTPGYSLNPNTNTCELACFTNAYRNSHGQCVCINGFYNQGNQCIPQGNCQNGYVWNGNSCACPTAMVIDSITNNCTYCNTPDRALANGKCGCSPTYYPTNVGCSPCIANAAYNATAMTCLCVTNYVMFNGQCVISMNCPANSYWNAGLQQCICNIAGQYVINGVCQSCPQNSVWNGSACACNQGYVSNNSLCIQNCSANSFWNGQVCQCNPNYYIISGICQLCDINSFYSNTKFTCVCKDGYFGTWNQCSKCDGSCGTCSGPGSNQCVTCPTNSNLVSGYCKVICAAGTYINSLNQCSPCDSSCTACSGPGNNLCTTCPSGFTLNNGYCKANTPTPTITSTITLKGYSLGTNKIYQGVAMNLMPTSILAAGCTVCNDLFTITVDSQFVTITASQQFITNTQYWFLITFDFTGASTVPTFSFTIKLNPAQASYFTSADMTQALTGSFSQSSFNSPAVASTPTLFSTAPSSSSTSSSSTSGITPTLINSIFGQNNLFSSPFGQNPFPMGQNNSKKNKGK